jgi:hypothetical protein
MKLRAVFFVVALAVLLAGCTAATNYSSISPEREVDDRTSYGVQRAEDGFQITVEYSKYQFYPQQSYVIMECRNQLRRLARNHAQKIGEQIQPIEKSQIEVSVGRNYISGVTTCIATSKVRYQ